MRGNWRSGFTDLRRHSSTFTDFQSDICGGKIEAALETSSLISASRSSIFAQNTGE